jgi:hypothetical protein
VASRLGEISERCGKPLVRAGVVGRNLAGDECISERSSEIQLTDEPGNGTGAIGDDGHKGFWESVKDFFGMDDDADDRLTYQEAIRRGGTLVRAAFRERTLEATETAERAVVGKEARVVDRSSSTRRPAVTPRRSPTPSVIPRSTSSGCRAARSARAPLPPHPRHSGGRKPLAGEAYEGRRSRDRRPALFSGAALPQVPKSSGSTRGEVATAPAGFSAGGSRARRTRWRSGSP